MAESAPPATVAGGAMREELPVRSMHAPKPSKPFLGVLFRCCGVYGRIYANARGSAYEGRCPRCMHPIRVRIDARTGVDARFLEFG
jgi:hypothetical protein